MVYLARIARFAFPALLALPFAGACGGQSFGQGGGDGGGSGSPAGGNGSGGKGTAGSSPKAGAPSGGSGAIGGTGATGGGAECNAAPDGGNCEAYFEAWYHDPATGICRPFVYGGCGGNENRYDSLEACQKACSGGQPNNDACTRASDCAVTGAGCCGACDGPNITKHDLIAFNVNSGAGFSCPDIECAPCAVPEPGYGTLSNFIADCVNQQCTVVDIRETSLTACKADTDCRVRNGNRCCESCGGFDLIAVRSDGSFEERVCGSELIGCAACVPNVAPNVTARCEPGGHCGLAVVGPATP